MFQSLTGQQRFLIDLSINELHLSDFMQLTAVIRKHPNVDMLVADNRFGWDAMREWLQNSFPRDGLP